MRRACCLLARLHLDRLPTFSVFFSFSLLLILSFRVSSRLHGLRFDRIFLSYSFINRLFVFILKLNGILHALLHFPTIWSCLPACLPACLLVPICLRAMLLRTVVLMLARYLGSRVLVNV